jgi:transcriptional regulator with XRE-family HTH domain
LRRGIAYEHPTPQKRAIGDRMRQAREIAGMSQQEVARQLGYSQQVQLSLMESGNRPVPSWVVVACSRLYGTTADYLLGLAPDSDPDPVTAVQRQVAAAVSADVRRLLREVSETGVAAVRELRQDGPRMQRMAVEVLRAAQALERVRQWKAFDKAAPSGALLVSALTAAAELAQQQVAAMQRAERLMGQRQLAVVGNACGHALDDDGADADLARALGPWSVPVDIDEDDDVPGDDADADALPAEQETPQ